MVDKCIGFENLRFKVLEILIICKPQVFISYGHIQNSVYVSFTDIYLFSFVCRLHFKTSW